MQHAISLVTGRFVPRTIVAGTYVAPDFLCYMWPIGISANHLDGFAHPYATSYDGIIHFPDDQLLER